MASSATRRKLTPQQTAAITTRRVSVALSAGAGCGKTFVLTERFLSHLDPSFAGIDANSSPARLDELIAITFTRRAAREMRERIRAACHARLIDSATAAEADHWLSLLRGLQRARISTIDSFCAEFLRTHAVEAGLDPSFRVLDGTQSATLLTEALDMQLRQLLSVQHEAIVSLAVDFGLRTVREMIRTLIATCREPAVVAYWRAQTPDTLVDLWETFRAEVYLPALVERLKGEPRFRKFFELLATIEANNPNWRQKQAALLAAWDELTPQSLEAAARQIVEHARVQGAGIKAALGELEIYETVKDTFTELREAAGKALDKLPWDREVARRAAAAGLQLLEVTELVQAQYSHLKEQAATLDFADLVARTRALLLDQRNGALRRRLSNGIRLLLVDEFQDTDPLQAELIEALCGDGLATGRLFFVGDFKQSIYRFRGADPAVFASLRARTSPAGQLPLSENFRSQPAILSFVNALFEDELGPAYEPLIPHRPQITPEPAIEFLWATPADGEENNAHAYRERDADWVARRLRGLLDSQARIVWDADAAANGQPTARAVRPGDITILFRALSDVQLYESALRRYGLEYYLVGGHAFYSQQEVFDLLNLLRTLNSPADQVSLLGVLRSPFFALDDETLFWLGQHPDGLRGGLADAASCQNLSEVQRERVLFADRTLTELRASKDCLPVAALVDRALALTGYDALLLTEFLGQRKLANLRKLIEQARSFDGSGVRTLDEFVMQLDEFVSRQPDEAMAATETEAADVIRLMTIHQSKGLEFPVVVVPDLQRASRNSGGAAFSRQLGPLVKRPADLEPSPGMTGRDLYGLVEAEQDRAEAARLLYVAATRAADYLILSSGVKAAGDAVSPWMKLLASRFDLTTGAYLHPLPAEARIPRVLVTSERPKLSDTAAVRSEHVDRAATLAAAEKLAAGNKALTLPATVDAIPVDLAGQRQFSFSEISGALQKTDLAANGDPVVPIGGQTRTMEEGQILGTLVHTLLSELPWAPALDLGERARGLVQLWGDALAAPRSAIDPLVEAAVTLAERFRQSPRFQQLLGAARVHAEMEFLLAWPPDGRGDEGVYFRGFIDCLYRDQQGLWHILDYKTNLISAAQAPRTADVYRLQMLLYALAAEQALGEPPASVTLSFLEPGIEHAIEYSPATRIEAIALLDAALATFRLGESSRD